MAAAAAARVFGGANIDIVCRNRSAGCVTRSPGRRESDGSGTADDDDDNDDDDNDNGDDRAPFPPPPPTANRRFSSSHSSRSLCSCTSSCFFIRRRRTHSRQSSAHVLTRSCSRALSLSRRWAYTDEGRAEGGANGDRDGQVVTRKRRQIQIGDEKNDFIFELVP